MAIRPLRMLDLLFPAAPMPELPVVWQPPVDLYRLEHGWLVKLDLAGVRPEEVEIRLDSHRLTIRGTRRDWRIHDRQEAHMMEIAYSRFERTLELPDEIQRAEIRTEYRDGMLLVHIKTDATS